MTHNYEYAFFPPPIAKNRKKNRLANDRSLQVYRASVILNVN